MDVEHRQRLLKAACNVSVKTKMPCIISDMDGVVVRGSGSNPDLVPGAGETLKKILSARKDGK